MNHLRLLFGIVVLIACLPVAAVGTQERKERLPRSGPINVLDVNRLTTKADLIVLAQVRSITDQEHAIAFLLIQKVIKGEASPEVVQVECEPELATGPEPIQPPLFGMFFLNRNANGSYRFTDANHAYLIAFPDASITAQTPLDRVVSITGEFIVKPGPIEYRRIAVYVLRAARSELSDKLLRQAARDADVVVRLQAISALVDHGDREAMATAEQILLNPPPRTDQYLLDNLSSALQSVKNP
jgi:hypothetical protein